MEVFNMKLFFVVCMTGFLTPSTALRECKQDDYHYEYTRCDENGKRWVVAVPDHEVCSPVKSASYEVPTKGVDCNKECRSGEYLDMGRQECQPCDPGTYSSGSSVRFEEWDPLPVGFSTSEESFRVYTPDVDTDADNCTEFKWTSKGSYIATVPGTCSSSLLYSTTLVKGGTLSFDYQYPSATSIFHITVQNDQCQAADDKDASTWPDTTDSGEWKSLKISLKSGFNVITWRVIGLGVDGQRPDPILLRKVVVTGVTYSSNCNKCQPGTYSSGGASYCTQCDVNQYADEKGTSSCKSCDMKTEYSVRGSTSCMKRVPCTEKDYYHLMTPCIDGKTQHTYQWIQPIICDADSPQSVKLPADTDPEDCKPCNPGMYLNNGTCMYCPTNQWSDGDTCQDCSDNTAPDYGYMFENWNDIPQDLRSLCEPFEDKNCSSDTRWLPFGDHIETHFARGESAYLVLQLEVSGFRTSEKSATDRSVTVGQIIINFETICNSYCQLVLLSDENGSQQPVKVWEFTQARQTFKYDIKKNTSCIFNLAFQNAGWLLLANQVHNSTAKIYSIEVTNTLGGGAKQCQKCPQGSNQDGCIPCEDGHYIDPVLTTCVKCPTGTVVYSHKAYGAESCVPCGKGLKVYKGRMCMSDGNFTSESGRNFDLTNMTSYNFVRGSRLFTSSGTQYFHGFNISLFGDPETSKVICENNVTKAAGASAMKEPERIVTKICRSTIVPSTEDGSDVMSTQATSLGDRIVAIQYNETELTVGGTPVSLTDLYKNSGFDDTDFEKDIQVVFAADTPTRACLKGRSSVVSLRCDPDKKDTGEVVMPPKCADGTCDGCTFHFLWLTRLACPVCQKSDYNRVPGECVQGYQTVHYFPPKSCLVKDDKKLEERQACSMDLMALPLMLQVLIPTFAGLALIFFFLICFFWRKNKKLEYRYMKLVEGSHGNEGELPGVDSCALEEGEYDEQGDAVQIRDSKGARFFKKLTNKIKKASSTELDDDAFDSAIMNERMPLT